MVPSAGARASGEGDERAQTSTIGVTLVIGFTLVGAVLIVGLSVTVFGDVQQTLTNERAEKTLTEFDSEAALVALGNTDTKRLNFATRGYGQYTVRPNAGNFLITVLNQSSGATCTLLDRNLGAVVYKNGDTTIAYQGGGVWRSSGSSSLMVSPPEFYYRNGTLTVPVITISGGQSLTSRAVIEHKQTVSVFPGENCGQSWQNPLKNSKVNVTVTSEYYLAWGSYFEERTTGGVSYDHDDKQVTLTLLKTTTQTIDNALLFTGGNGTLQIQAGTTSVIDSYDSAEVPSNLGPGNPPSTYGDNGGVVTTLDVEFSGNARLRGNLTTSGEITALGGHKGSGSPYQITGYLKYGEGTLSKSKCQDHVAGWCNDNATSLDKPIPMDDEIRNTIATLSNPSNNDNDDERCFNTNNGLLWSKSGCGPTITLDAGSYYTKNNFQVGGGQKLLLNTTGGNIRIAVDNNQSVQIQGGGGANVTVLGNGRAKIYNEEQIQIQNKNTIVWNRGWDATQMWLYCTADCQIQINSGKPKFVGAIYAAYDPDNPDAGNGQIQIQNNAVIWGGIVGAAGNGAQVQGNSIIHYDQALARTTVTQQPKVPGISYLHISLNRISVED